MKLAAGLLGVVAACGGGESVDKFRVVVISDTHITGPQYVCCTESNERDNASIQRTEERLNRVVDQINAIRPAPDMVFVLGDVMHNPYYSLDPAYYENTDTAWSITPRILGRLAMPYQLVWGNHDYDVSCDGGDHVSRELTHQLMREHFGTEPYHAVDHKGWRFLFGNSQLGATWDPLDPACETGTGSFGMEQLAWVDAQLEDGLPTIFMSHHGQFVIDDDEGGDSLTAVLSRHSNAVAHLAGHAHTWIDFDESSYSFQHFIVASTRYDADNFWLLELDATGHMEILDKAKIKKLSLCSDGWDYDGTPKPTTPAPPEDGDC
jgi:predicted MPP superfamily phosphohydrolase